MIELMARLVLTAVAFVAGLVVKRLPQRVHIALVLLFFASLLVGCGFLLVVGDTFQRVVGVVCGLVMLWIVVNGVRMLIVPSERWLSLDADALRRWSVPMGLDEYPWHAIEDITARAKSVTFIDTRYGNDVMAFLFRSGTFIVTDEPEALAQRMRAAKAAAA